MLLFLLHFYIVSLIFGIYYHRGIAHKLLTFSKPFEHFSRFILYTVGQGTSSDWMKYMCAQHRLHHSVSDMPCDINSPHHKPFLSYIHKRFDKNFKNFDAKNLDKFAPEIQHTNDWVQTNIYNKFPYLGICIMGLVYCMVYNIWYGIFGIVMSYIIGKYLLMIFADYVLHHVGYRTEPNKNSDRSINFFPIAFFMSGEELHSNHHNHPGRVNQAIAWYEFDFGYYWILLFAKLRLLSINRR